MDSFDPSGYDCPQYVHFLNEDELHCGSDSYFDVLTPVQNNASLKAQDNFPDSLMDATEDAPLPKVSLKQKNSFTDSLMENKENNSSTINIEDEEFISSPIYCEELCRDSYHFRITPARMKKRGTGLFSSSKKNKSRSVSVGAKKSLTRQLFDTQRVSTPFKSASEHDGELETFAKLNEVGELQDPLFDSQQGSAKEKKNALKVKRVTRSSSRSKKQSCNSSVRTSNSNLNASSGFVNEEKDVYESASLSYTECASISEMDQTEDSDCANLTQDPKLFPVKFSRDSSEKNLVEQRLTRSRSNSVPSISEMNQTEDSDCANLTQDPKLFPVKFSRDSSEKNVVEQRLTRSRSNSIPSISEMDQTQESERANLTQDPKMFPVQYAKDDSDNVIEEKRRSSRSRSNSVTMSTKPIPSKPFAKPITRVRPFNFTENRNVLKRKCEETEDYLPMAEQVAKFQKKTPQRFHSTANKVFQPSVHWSPRLVVPHSPNLQARKRIRGRTVLSQKELEDQQVEDMRQYKFQARAFNPKLIKPHKVKVQQKMLTKPKDMKLQTSVRTVVQNKINNKHVEEKYEFHAMPLPKHILEGPVGLKEKKLIPPTVPESPMFALKERNAKWRAARKSRENTPDPKVFKFTAKPIRHPVKPKVMYEPKRCTQIEPFSFDEKDKIRFSRKEEKIQMEIEKESSISQFRAQPLPSPLPSKLPTVLRKENTKPIPFNFQLEQSVEKKKRSFLEEDKYEFKAQPAIVLTKEPFKPAKAVTHLPVEEFTLHTDIRAVQRLQLKEIQDAQNAERQQEYLRQQEIAAEREKFEIQELRKQLVHKAKPIRQYKPMEKLPPGKGTEPLSPKFATNSRLRVRH